MSMNDPLGDMLARIRNGQAAALEGADAGLEAARAACSMCCSAKATSAASPRMSCDRALSELEIELKYYDGEPVIREIARVSKPGRRVYSAIARTAAGNNGLGISILSTPKGVMSDTEARAANVGGEVSAGCTDHVAYRQESGRRPGGRHRQLEGQTVKAKGKGRARARSCTTRSSVKREGDGSLHAAQRQPGVPVCMWGTARNLASNMVKGVTDGFSINLEIIGVGYRAQVEGQGPEAAARLHPRRRGTDPRRHPDQGAEADRDRDHRHRQAEGRRDRRRDPRASVRPSPTRARASSSRARRSAARKARRSREPCPTATPASRRRQRRTRHALRQVAGDRPRLSVFRSGKHIYAQVIDDGKGATLASASTLDKDVRGKIKTGANKEAANEVGKLIAVRALAAGVKEVVFDRGGYIYHGRIAALADAAREGGLSF